MPEINESNEVNETSEVSEEVEEMDSEFETELDSKCDEYTREGRSFEDIQRDKEELLQMREELMKYKETQESDPPDDEDGDPEKVLKLTRHR